MSILSDMFGGAAAVTTGGASVVAGTFADAATKIINRYIPDPQEQAKARTELLNSLSSSDTAQAGINLAEANSASPFRGNWRPALGWICAACCAWNWVIISVLRTALALTGHTDIVLVENSPAQMELVLYGLLGLAGWRSIDKINNRG